MANLDTRSKRTSSVGLLRPYAAALILPDGTIGQGDRQHAAWGYSGILASTEAVTPGALGGRKHSYRIHDEPQRRKRRFIITESETIEAAQERKARKQKQARVFDEAELRAPEQINIGAEISAIEAHLARAAQEQANADEQRRLALLQTGVILLEAKESLNEYEFNMLMMMAA